MTINIYAPFTENQINYLRLTNKSWLNVAEGGKRGSKNVLNTLAWALTLENHPDRFHLAAGVDISAARVNIIECDGFGLTNLFEGRYREGKYKNKDCLYLKTKAGEKIIFYAGGKRDGDEKNIKGYTYGTVYITEVNECHPKFVQECFDRTLSSKDRKIFHDLNPKSPGHWYYTDLIDFHEQKQLDNPKYGYNYGHFTILDNLSIDSKRLKKELNTYDKGSIWYERDILGKRRQIEGLVYQMFNYNFHVVKTEPRPYEQYYVSMDYGTQHPCVFQLWGLANGIWYCVREYFYEGSKGRQKDSTEYYNDVLKLVDNLPIKSFILDNAPIASSFGVLVKRLGKFKYRMADDDVAEGIQDTATALRQGIIKFNDCCKNTINEFGLFLWDDKSTIDEPLKINDDAMSAMRYFVRTLRIATPKQKGLRID